MKRILFSLIICFGVILNASAITKAPMESENVYFVETTENVQINEEVNQNVEEILTDEEINFTCCEIATSTVWVGGNAYTFFGSYCAGDCTLAYIVASNRAGSAADAFVKGFER